MSYNRIQSDLIKDYNESIKQLSKIIFEWNLTNSDSKNELYDFSIKILNHLIEEQNDEKIKQIIENELCVDYGLYIDEFNSEELTNEIINWWNQKLNYYV